MLKNILIGALSVGIMASLVWAQAEDDAPIQNKPQVHVFIPNGYCGEFVVFWGKNVPAVDEPPEHLSYNYYPEHPNAVMINLPEPYRRAGLRFIYKGQDGPVGRNPIFKMTGITGVTLHGGVETMENGYTRTLPGIDTGVEADIFAINKSAECNAEFHMIYYRINELYFSVTGNEK